MTTPPKVAAALKRFRDGYAPDDRIDPAATLRMTAQASDMLVRVLRDFAVLAAWAATQTEDAK